MLTILIFFPLFAGLAILMSGENAKRIALAAALIEFAISVSITLGFDPTAGTQFVHEFSWGAALGIS